MTAPSRVPSSPVLGVRQMHRAQEGKERGKAEWAAGMGWVFPGCLSVESGWQFWTEDPGEAAGFLWLSSGVLVAEIVDESHRGPRDCG